MRHEEAMARARAIAKKLLQGSRKIGHTNVGEVQGSLFGWLSLHLAAAKSKEGDIDGAIASMDPAIHEIILFGSTACGSDSPGDIDLMVFDKGFYSNVLGFEPPEKKGETADWYGNLRENLNLVLTGWMGMQDQDVGALIETIPVDLHVLPLGLFHDALLRRHIADKHADPEFFQNAFSAMKRFDPLQEVFVDTDISYFEIKYSTDLSDLRRPLQ